MEFTVNQAEKEAYLNYALSVLAKRVGITQAQSETCATHFRGITEFLDNSELRKFKPKLRIQGSNRIGTAIRSIGNDDGFDVDIVCELQCIPNNWTPKMVKEAIGGILLGSKVYGELIENKLGGKRCWTIQFKDGIHADILPAVVNDDYNRIAGEEYFDSYEEFGIRITDKTRVPEYYLETDRSKWLLSNPIGFAEWFFAQARYHDYKHKGNIRMVRASVEPFPVWNANSMVLQDIVKLLKRHRDVIFDGRDKKPISMIITVLAAKSYIQAPAGNLLQTLDFIANHMVQVMNWDSFTLRRKVLNPINRDEDFTDRWKKDGQRETNFYEWVEQLKNDITYLKTQTRVGVGEAFKRIFGQKVGEDVVREITSAEKSRFKQDGLRMSSTGVLGTVGAFVTKSHSFYGQ